MPHVMPVTDWKRIEDFEQFLGEAGTGFFLKHSTRCPVSGEAAREFRRFLDEHPDATVHRILVIEDRPVSNAISERLGIPHASPQAVFLRSGVAVWNASHWEVTAEALGQVWSGA